MRDVKNGKIFKIVSFVVFLIAMLVLTSFAVKVLKYFNNAAAMEEYVESVGTWGILLMLLLQIAQIVVAIIPGEVVEFLSGTLYAWYGGLLLCTVGVLIGELIVFYAVRIFGKNLVEKAAGSEKLKKYKFLQDEKKLKRLIFILFFIPGTPKDTITYIAPLTKIDAKSFLAITVIARIPSIVTSTIAGDALVTAGVGTTIAIYAGICIMSLCGVVFYKRWEKKHNGD